MTRIIEIFIAICALAANADASMIDVVRAAVRVSTDEGGGMKSYGSGGIVGSDDSSYLVVTCEHVANRNVANIEIVRFGQPIKTVRGTVVGRDANSDCAFIRIKKADLGDVVPGLLPVDAAFELKPGDLLWGASFPQGGALTVFEMSYIGMTADGWIEAKPSIKQGRSGGIVVDSEGTRVIGITWGTSEDRCYIVPAKRFAKAVGKELTNVEAPVAALDFTVAEKALFNRKTNDGTRRIVPPRAEQPRRPWKLTPRQRPVRPIPEGVEEINPNAPIQPSQLKIQIGDVTVEHGAQKPAEVKPAPAPPLPPPYWRPFPPPFRPLPPPGPVPAPVPRPLPPPGHNHAPQFRGQSYSTGSCPGGTCPTPGFESIQTTRPKSADVKPKNPLPVQTLNETRSTLPEPDLEPLETPARTAIKPLPIQTIQDPRLDKIPGIEQTLFGISTGQSGIEKKVDSTLEKVGQLIDEKKDAVKVDLEQFRNETLTALDERTATLKVDIDQRLALVQGELQKLEATNEQIAQLKESIDNFSVFPDASGFVGWLKEWGWFLVMFVTVVVLGGLQAKQYYDTHKQPMEEVKNAE